MSFVKGFIMSLGMFSIFPVPKNNWQDNYMPMVIPSLPIVGAFIGIIWYGSTLILSKLTVPLPIQSVIVLFIPLILSGFIHADGYMDTLDAICSRKELEEKKKILKDAHTGAFAVIAIIGILLFQFCAVQTILDAQKKFAVFAFIPIMSRCVAGIAVLNLHPVFETGYSASFRKNAKPLHTVFICSLTIVMFIIALCFPGISVMPLLVEALAGLFVTAYVYMQFRGISGDLCGCIITISEFAALLSMALI